MNEVLRSVVLPFCVETSDSTRPRMTMPEHTSQDQQKTMVCALTGHFAHQTCLQGSNIIGPRREKTCLRGFANKTGADQPAHPRRLISAFVIHVLKSIISKLATGEILFFYLVSVAEETGLKLALSDTPKTGFLAKRLIL